MTNWDKIREGVHILAPEMTAEEFAEWVDCGELCRQCAIRNRCDREVFMTDAEGNLLRNEKGDYIIKDGSKNCDEILMEWLEEEYCDEQPVL